jgi:beta-mannanase
MIFYRYHIVIVLVLISMLGLPEVSWIAEAQGQLIQKRTQRQADATVQTPPPPKISTRDTVNPGQRRLIRKRTPRPSNTTPPSPAPRDYASLKIVPHPSGGMYVGQYEWVEGDIATFEAAGGRKTALWSKHQGSWANGYDASGQPHFDVQAANKAWQEGKVILVQMYNTTPTPGESEAPPGFTVDKLLSGRYDSDLGRFASELRQFGKPVFFTTGREPNGVEAAYFGGFGPAGDKSLLWALENKRGVAEFDPSRMPYATRLYSDIGGAQVCDGVERLKAAQRYYHDFFVRREGLKFLAFDTMGWAVRQLNQIDYDIADLPPHVDKAYARTLMTSCHDFRNFYPGNDYVDWVSLNFYMLDYYAKDWPGLIRDHVVSVDEHMRELDKVMSEVKQIAPGKPVFFMELGFPDGLNQNSNWAAEKIRLGFQRILASHPQIQGFAMWSAHPSWMSDFPWDCLIRPNTQQGTALKASFASTPTKFHSCVYLSDGKPHPLCTN